MALPATPAAVDERDFYPLHEEDDVGENPEHYDQAHYLVSAVRIRRPDWFVTGNICVYWVPGNHRRYRAPDVLAVSAKVEPSRPRVYLVWQDPPVNFVAEVGSRSSLREDEGPKVKVYQNQVRAREYLYADPPRGIVRLWRMDAKGVYVERNVEPNGRMRSAELDLEFGLDADGFLRVYLPDGELILTHEEEVRRRQEAEARVAEEARQREELEREIAALRARLGEAEA